MSAVLVVLAGLAVFALLLWWEAVFESIGGWIDSCEEFVDDFLWRVRR